ncbi:hypothetical protein SAMN04489761_2795 [Tenacibaculum sp. MAR_2009_124]|uniref:hypothetical protein n=1 Tax=Tenacibaculum sp. MAR_2009_124 TaxID=1250059 RepID=UPI000897B9EB|nr:hypothetical protein [Tenacibaculum sp. MAR_2009_124]SEC36757.1 hypothetical protein SAMN04489761_2795 [Tenacibaculum sp. MAR_2009_124]
MKKDIHIPKVTDIEMAIALEYNEAHNVDEWIVYLINKKETPLEMVVIVSQGFSETKTTSVFRKKIDLLPGQSSAKIELIQPELFALDNRFQVTFFENNTLYDKTFLFKKDTIKENNLSNIKELNKQGIVCK